MTRNLKHAVGKIQNRKKDREYRLPGILGLRRGSNNVVSVPGRPSFVYVRLRNNTSEVIQAFNDKVSPVYDLPVLVVRDEIDPSKYRIESRDYGQYSNWNSWSPYLPAHGGTHSRSPTSGGGDVVWVYGDQYMPLYVSPSGTLGSGNVIIDPHTYYFEDHDQYKHAGGTGTQDILSYKPTGSDARMVLIYLDTDGNPALLPGSDFDVTLTGTVQTLPHTPTINVDTGLPLASVRLVSGTSSIVWNNLYDLRPLIAGQRRSKVTIFDDGVYQTSGTAISFEDNLDVVVSGSVAFVSGQGGGGGGGDLVVYDDSVYQVTGTAISFDTDLDVSVTGSTAYVSASGGGGYTEGARVYNSSNISVSNSAWQALTFDSESYDTDTIHSTVSNTSRLTCQTAGKYIIVGNVYWGYTTTGRLEIKIRLNNTTDIARVSIDAQSGISVPIQNITTIYDLSASDYVELLGFQSSGGSISATAANRYSPDFMMQRIG